MDKNQEFNTWNKIDSTHGSTILVHQIPDEIIEKAKSINEKRRKSNFIKEFINRLCE